MLTSDRAVLIRYMRDGKPRRGSGLRIAGRFVLTAGHCAAGNGHTVIVAGGEHPAAVFVCSGTAAVDVALLESPSLPVVEPLTCAVVDRRAAWELEGCLALGFPVWKDRAAGPLLAQVPGHVPTAEGMDPQAKPSAIPAMTLKITNPDIKGKSVPLGDLDQPGSPWAGMSGAAVVTGDGLVLGVIRGHSPAEGAGSLTATRLEAIASLPDDVVRKFLSALQTPDLPEWPRIPASAEDGVTMPVRAGQVVVGEIPREPPGFVARKTLSHLTEAAERGRVAVVCALTGMRGVGKTQVAAAYARTRVNEGWGLVGWVNAETRDTLLSGLARIAERLGVADPEGDSLESARRLREHLQTRPGEGLVVFDNATDPDGLRPFLPATGTIQIVVTSTDQAFVEFGEAVEVAAFTRQESLAYLRARTELDDQIGANAVAAELGDLPLGVAQAAATIRRQHLTYPTYLQRLREVPVNALLGRIPGADYPYPAAAALLLSIQAAEADDPSGLLGSLLHALAALSPGGVRRDILDGLEPSGSGAGTQQLDAAIEQCVARSLLTWSVTGESLVMHRLLSRVLRGAR